MNSRDEGGRARAPAARRADHLFEADLDALRVLGSRSNIQVMFERYRWIRRAIEIPLDHRRASRSG